MHHVVKGASTLVSGLYNISLNAAHPCILFSHLYKSSTHIGGMRNIHICPAYELHKDPDINHSQMVAHNPTSTLFSWNFNKTQKR